MIFLLTLIPILIDDKLYDTHASWTLYMRNMQMVGNTNRVILLAMMEFELFVPRSKPHDLRC